MLRVISDLLDYPFLLLRGIRPSTRCYRHELGLWPKAYMYKPGGFYLMARPRYVHARRIPRGIAAALVFIVVIAFYFFDVRHFDKPYVELLIAFMIVFAPAILRVQRSTLEVYITPEGEIYKRKLFGRKSLLVQGNEHFEFESKMHSRHFREGKKARASTSPDEPELFYAEASQLFILRGPQANVRIPVGQFGDDHELVEAYSFGAAIRFLRTQISVTIDEARQGARRLEAQPGIGLIAQPETLPVRQGGRERRRDRFD